MKYKQMTWNDRVKMETLLNAGHNRAYVAKFLHFSRATITREYKRGIYIHTNSDLTECERYSAEVAQRNHEYMQTSKGRPLKVGNDMEFVDFLEKTIIKDGCSPAVALALARLQGFKTSISSNTLYRYIDKGLFLELTNKKLPVKSKRKKHPKKVRVQKRASAGESIENRNKDILSRNDFGHWEMDTVRGKQGVSKTCLLVLTERKTRNEIIRKMPDGKARSVVSELDKLEKRLGGLFQKLFKTITVDNGVEFADYAGMKRSLLHPGTDRTKVYYCHPYSSYERGSNENANKLIRRHIPKGKNTDRYSHQQIRYIQDWINNYPRKLHGWRTAGELFRVEIAQITPQTVIL